MMGSAGRLLVALAAGLAVAGCEYYAPPDTLHDMKNNDSVFGEGGLLNFSVGGNKAQPGSGITVNTYLWRATLDTVAFMPLSSADPFGGVIITDWYSPPESPNE